MIRHQKIIKKHFANHVPEFQEAYYKQFVHESSYEEFMFSLGEADKYCQLTRDIPLVVLAAGKKLLFARCTNKMVTIAKKNYYDYQNKNKLIIAEQSGHYIQKDEPHYITDAVRWIIEVRER